MKSVLKNRRIQFEYLPHRNDHDDDSGTVRADTIQIQDGYREVIIYQKHPFRESNKKVQIVSHVPFYHDDSGTSILVKNLFPHHSPFAHLPSPSHLEIWRKRTPRQEWKELSGIFWHLNTPTDNFKQIAAKRGRWHASVSRKFFSFREDSSQSSSTSSSSRIFEKTALNSGQGTLCPSVYQTSQSVSSDHSWHVRKIITVEISLHLMFLSLEKRRAKIKWKNMRKR